MSYDTTTQDNWFAACVAANLQGQNPNEGSSLLTQVVNVATAFAAACDAQMNTVTAPIAKTGRGILAYGLAAAAFLNAVPNNLGASSVNGVLPPNPTLQASWAALAVEIVAAYVAAEPSLAA